ncbi:DNA-formamidopyrimidine glycosylase family protein [Sediminivirga luteola]|uniref:DNA-formamidopyrimidine glycosylase family protein n=1 Tax=Sediminivirga luteola TaxID=1774748 RepID=UPI001F5A292F|nr:DNA-formamidopyrimidine glycosylase family protein [Sediminivirga luteola]MCI2263984.1 Fpg/Nei family DNA glycosylase [Sediminivirga luteola]
MPEGDTAHRTARMLHAALAGAVLERFELRVPRAAIADLRGSRVDEVLAVGKHLLHRIGGYTLHSHLKMEGRWETYRRGARWRRPAFRARAVLATQRIEAVGFDLAQVRLVPRERESLLIGHLGPDPLGPGWNSRTARAAGDRLAADARPLHMALLDQRLVAGFGNEYANEICFLLGVRPQRPAQDADAHAALELGARLIRQNVERPVRTTTGDPRRRLFVCFRDGQPCRRCGTVIQRGRLGPEPLRERDVYWCPHCQR